MVLLAGELGTGKTVVAQGIGGGLGVRDAIKSSSFVIMNDSSTGRAPSPLESYLTEKATRCGFSSVTASSAPFTICAFSSAAG